MGLKNKNSLYKLYVFIIYSAIFFVLLGCSSRRNSNLNSDNPFLEKSNINISLIDGLPTDQLPELKPVAVVMDNFFASRPPSGLNNASIIYEVLMEAKISRFLAVFRQDNLPDKIGPVRSTRPYLTELAAEYSPIFVHAGGSPEALAELKNNKYLLDNLDGLIDNGSYFWRDKDRQPPFNLYVNGQQLQKLLKDESRLNGFFDGWLFYEPGNRTRIGSVDSIAKEAIILNFFEPIVWNYNKEKNIYQRFWQDGDNLVSHLDDTDQPITTNNLILQFVKVTTIDSIGRKKIDLNSGGQAKIYQNGKMLDVFWQKKNNRTVFYNEFDQEIYLNAGRTWIELIPLP